MKTMRRLWLRLLAVGMGGGIVAAPLVAAPAGQVRTAWSAGDITVPGSTFELHPSLDIQLVAAEPLLASPVAIAFDAAARLYVVEMLDYPERSAAVSGRVILLEDADGDGSFDRRTVFAENIPWASGVACWQGGVLVASTPDVLYLKDSDGDGRADVRQVVFTGFGGSVPQPAADMVVSGFAWGLDHRFYGSTAPNGGRITKPGSAAPPVDLRGRDFSIDPVAMTLRPESGVAQFGISFDDFGRRFASTNSRHLLLAMYEQRYADRNPLFEMPRPMLDIPADGPAAEVFRISPEEEWRVIRTQWRVSGKVVGMIEGGGRPSGYFTSACGVTIYRGDALPPAFYGQAFVAEPAGNLVHRKRLEEDGVALVGRRLPEEQKTEVLRSSDPLFRPVNFANGPDGALYVVDMHRQIVELASGIPEEIRRKIDIHGGRDTGRIYRIAAKGNGPRKLPTLATAATADLVAQLGHPNAWARETAARLLFERQDPSAVPALERLARDAAAAPARVQALYSLSGLRALQPRHLQTALRDREAGVREHAVRLSEAFFAVRPEVAAADEERGQLRAAVVGLAGDPAKRVRYQLAFTLGELPAGNDVDEALFRVVTESVEDRWITAAGLSSMNDRVHTLFARASADAALLRSADGVDLVGRMLGLVGARAKPPELASAVAFLGRAEPEETQMKLVNAFQAGLKRAGRSLRDADPDGGLDRVFAAAAARARDTGATETARITAIRLAAESRAGNAALFLELLRPSEPERIQVEAVTALGVRPPPDLAIELTRRWNEFTARVRQEALKLLIAQPARMLVLLDAVRAQTIRRSDMTPSQIQFLKNHPDAKVREAAEGVFAATAGNRQKVIDAYLPALALPADAGRGRDVFRAQCAACHKLNGEGFEVGTNLLGVKSRGKEGLLIDILDPNRRVEPSYLFYEIVTRKGDVVMGAIAAESAGSITVQQPQGERLSIPRSDIATMKAGSQSLMPEGLEAAIKPQDMADLLEYLVSVQ